MLSAPTYDRVGRRFGRTNSEREPSRWSWSWSWLWLWLLRPVVRRGPSAVSCQARQSTELHGPRKRPFRTPRVRKTAHVESGRSRRNPLAPPGPLRAGRHGIARPGWRAPRATGRRAGCEGCRPGLGRRSIRLRHRSPAASDGVPEAGGMPRERHTATPLNVGPGAWPFHPGSRRDRVAYSATMSAVTMPNIPWSLSAWLRMWQWNAQTPTSVASTIASNRWPGAILSVSQT